MQSKSRKTIYRAIVRSQWSVSAGNCFCGFSHMEHERNEEKRQEVELVTNKFLCGHLKRKPELNP